VTGAGPNPVKLRAHHLLCILTFVGEGYSPAFIANERRVIERIAAGDTVRIVPGPDDICAGVDSEGRDPHCLRGSVARRDHEARVSLANRFPALTPAFNGADVVIDEATIGAMQRAFADGTIRASCLGCPWDELCTSVAASGFARTVFAAAASATYPAPQPPIR